MATHIHHYIRAFRVAGGNCSYVLIIFYYLTYHNKRKYWIPAIAGMTKKRRLRCFLADRSLFPGHDLGAWLSFAARQDRTDRKPIAARTAPRHLQITCSSFLAWPASFPWLISGAVSFCLSSYLGIWTWRSPPCDVHIALRCSQYWLLFSK